MLLLFSLSQRSTTSLAIVLIFSGVRKSRSLLTKTDEDALELLLDYLQKIPSCVLLKELAGLKCPAYGIKRLRSFCLLRFYV